jgi:hypothetical protein
MREKSTQRGVPDQHRAGLIGRFLKVWNGSKSSNVQELFSKNIDPKTPLQGQEFYELGLFEKANQLGTRY